jgi:hypothetical protein
MLKVGGEVDAFCTRCEMDLAHTIIAMMNGRPVKVECNTCHGVHKYRGSAGSSSSSRTRAPGTPRPAREKPQVVSFDELLRGKDVASAKRYSPRDSYEVDQVLDHPTFGMGFVSSVKDGGKIEVTFLADVKILVHGKK